MNTAGFIDHLADLLDSKPERIAPYAAALQSAGMLPANDDEISAAQGIDLFLAVVGSATPGAATAALRVFGMLPAQEYVEGGVSETGAAFHGPRRLVADAPLPAGEGKNANRMMRSLRDHIGYAVDQIKIHPNPSRKGKWLSLIRDLHRPEAQIYYDGEDGKAHWLIFRRDRAALYERERVTVRVDVPRFVLVGIAQAFGRKLPPPRLAPSARWHRADHV